MCADRFVHAIVVTSGKSRHDQATLFEHTCRQPLGDQSDDPSIVEIDVSQERADDRAWRPLLRINQDWLTLSKKDWTSQSRTQLIRRLPTASSNIGLAPGRAIMRVSRPAGFHHRPLAEPSVRLSPHSAPIRQTCRSYRAANVRKDSRFPGQAFRESAPSALSPLLRYAICRLSQLLRVQTGSHTQSKAVIFTTILIILIF